MLGIWEVPPLKKIKYQKEREIDGFKKEPLFSATVSGRHLDRIFNRERRNPLITTVDDVISDTLRACKREVSPTLYIPKPDR